MRVLLRYTLTVVSLQVCVLSTFLLRMLCKLQRPLTDARLELKLFLMLRVNQDKDVWTRAVLSCIKSLETGINSIDCTAECLNRH